MKVSFSAKVGQTPDAARLLQPATKLLEEIIGASRDPVEVEWGLTEDVQGRSRYTLRLSDWSGAVTEMLAPWEFEQANQLQWRLNRLWGDLLQIRSHKQLEELLEKNA